jgi:hypothetical protein
MAPGGLVFRPFSPSFLTQRRGYKVVPASGGLALTQHCLGGDAGRDAYKLAATAFIIDTGDAFSAALTGSEVEGIPCLWGANFTSDELGRPGFCEDVLFHGLLSLH